MYLDLQPHSTPRKTIEAALHIFSQSYLEACQAGAIGRQKILVRCLQQALQSLCLTEDEEESLRNLCKSVVGDFDL